MILKELFNFQEERSKGTSNLKLTSEGIEQAVWIGEHLAKKLHGKKVFKIYCNDLVRSSITAKIISQYCNAPIVINNSLYPWHMGMLEGMTIRESKPIWMDFVKYPDSAIPGKGPLSQYYGESFNSFKDRWLTYLSKHMVEMKERNDLIKIFVTHSRNINLTFGWIAAGGGQDFKIIDSWMAKKPDPPSSIHLLSYINEGVTAVSQSGYTFTGYSIRDMSTLRPGIYLIRHGKTSWNS